MQIGCWGLGRRVTTRLELLQSAVLVATGLLLQLSGSAMLLFAVSCSWFFCSWVNFGLTAYGLGLRIYRGTIPLATLGVR